MTGRGHEEIFGSTANPCPWWCDLPDGHGFDTRDAVGDATRVHSKSVGVVVRDDCRETCVFVEANETLTLSLSGAETRLSLAECSVDDAENLRPGEARQLATLLTLAADLIASMEQEPPERTVTEVS